MWKTMQAKHEISSEIHQDYAKTCPIFAYKTLVLLKTRSKIDVSTYERVQNVSVCGRVLSVDFECFYELL